MVKKNILFTICILSLLIVGAQTVVASSSANNSSENLHPTHINLYVEYSNTPYSFFDPVQNPHNADIYASLVDEATGKKLGGRNIKFELISPEYGISEIQYDTTSKLSLFRHEAWASFEGPFTSGIWKVRASYGGNSKDHLAPCVAYINLKKV